MRLSAKDAALVLGGFGRPSRSGWHAAPAVCHGDDADFALHLRDSPSRMPGMTTLAASCVRGCDRRKIRAAVQRVVGRGKIDWDYPTPRNARNSRSIRRRGYTEVGLAYSPVDPKEPQKAWFPKPPTERRQERKATADDERQKPPLRRRRE